MNIYDVRGSGVMRYDGDQDQTGISGGYSSHTYIKVLLGREAQICWLTILLRYYFRTY